MAELARWPGAGRCPPGYDGGRGDVIVEARLGFARLLERFGKQLGVVG
ncbi:hypothetical protein [Verrucomicrobium spinosum]|nr:hypothetical protein [Verrucomicrobium spinosum]